MKTDKKTIETYFLSNYESYDKMITYCKQQIKKNKSANAMVSLGLYYDIIERNETLMLNYYKMASKLENTNAYMRLAHYYSTIEKYDKMKYYFVKAFHNSYWKALYSMGLHYENVEVNVEKAKKYYVMYYRRAPDDERVLKRLYELYYKTEDWNSSLMYYIKYIQVVKEIVDKDKGIHLLRECKDIEIPISLIYMLFEMYYSTMDMETKRLLYARYSYGEKECFICLQEKPIITLYHCHHEVCYECLCRIDKCPYCRKSI